MFIIITLYRWLFCYYFISYTLCPKNIWNVLFKINHGKSILSPSKYSSFVIIHLSIPSPFPMFKTSFEVVMHKHRWMYRCIVIIKNPPILQLHTTYPISQTLENLHIEITINSLSFREKFVKVKNNNQQDLDFWLDCSFMLILLEDHFLCSTLCFGL